MFVYDPNTCRYIEMNQNPIPTPIPNQQTQWDWQRLTQTPWIYPPTTCGPVCGYWIPQPVMAPVYDPNYIRTYADPMRTQQNANIATETPNVTPNTNVNTGAINPNTTCPTMETRPQDPRQPMFHTPYAGTFGNTVVPYMTPFTPPMIHPMMQPPYSHIPMCYYPTPYPMTQPVQITPQQNWTPWNWNTNIGYTICR
jgi:hypothetical protein